jgi:hypothetical protein
MTKTTYWDGYSDGSANERRRILNILEKTRDETADRLVTPPDSEALHAFSQVLLLLDLIKDIEGSDHD